MLRAFASVYVWFFRGVPALIQLIFWFNLSLLVREFSLTLPFIGTIFSVRTNDFMTPFVSAVVALSLCEAGYMAEIIRAGIKSVPAGQTEAASAPRHALSPDPEAHHAAASHALRRAARPATRRSTS